MTSAKLFIAPLLFALASCGPVPLDIGPDGLTEPERASLSQRGLTAQEQAERRAGCRRPPLDTLSDEFASYGRAYVVDFPGQKILKISETLRTPSGGSSVNAYPALPNGGIGGKDLCPFVELRPVAPDGPLLSISGLSLRRGIDIARDYPSAVGVLDRLDRILDLPRSRYVVIFPPEGQSVEGLAKDLQTDPRIDQTGFRFVFKSSVMMPLI